MLKMSSSNAPITNSIISAILRLNAENPVAGGCELADLLLKEFEEHQIKFVAEAAGIIESAFGSDVVDLARQLVGRTLIVDPPAAACMQCGGWTGFGGMSQYSEAVEPVEGRSGCICHNAELNAKIEDAECRRNCENQNCGMYQSKHFPGCEFYVADVKGYRGRVVAKTGKLLTGGVKSIESSLFETKAQAESWIEAIKDFDSDRIELDRVIEIRHDAGGVNDLATGPARIIAEYTATKPDAGTIIDLDRLSNRELLQITIDRFIKRQPTEYQDGDERRVAANVSKIPETDRVNRAFAEIAKYMSAEETSEMKAAGLLDIKDAIANYYVEFNKSAQGETSGLYAARRRVLSFDDDIRQLAIDEHELGNCPYFPFTETDGDKLEKAERVVAAAAELEPGRLEHLQAWAFEVYTKNPETGETGFDIKFVRAFGSIKAEAVEHLRSFPNFDCIITADARHNGSALSEADVAAYAAGDMFRETAGY